MDKHYVVGASVVALCAALGLWGPAVAAPSAARTITVPVIADYNAAQVKTAGDIVTVPTGLATYSVVSGSLEINSRFTVTLPAGFSFSSQPALTDTGTTAFTLSSGGIGAQTATFTVTGAPLTPEQSASLTSFAVQGVSVLETPLPAAAALPITVQSTNNSQINNNDPKPLSAKAFASEPGAMARFIGSPRFVDLSSPILGTEFFVDPVTDTTTVVVGALEPEGITAQQNDASGLYPVLKPDGTPNALSTADTATVTISGVFDGISAAFVATDGTCVTSISAGTVAPTSVTFPGVVVGPEAFFCVTADGTTLLPQNVLGFQPTITPGTSTDFLGTLVDIEFPGFWDYSGGGVIDVTNFFTGDDAGYASLLRVNNAGNSSATIFALVQPDTGGVPLSGSLGSIGGGAGTVFSEAQVAAAVSGLDLANSGQRATLQLIVSGPDFSQVKASSFLVNPGGVVDNVGVQPNIPPPG